MMSFQHRDEKKIDLKDLLFQPKKWDWNYRGFLENKKNYLFYSFIN
jgi:hypothetical protein